MTNELEKQFFDTFGIEAKSLFICKRGYYPEVCTQPTCKGCNEAIEHGKYPQITDSILLELICIWNLYCTHTLIPTDYQKVKEYVLEQFANIDTYKFIVDTPIVKHQVRILFEEG